MRFISAFTFQPESMNSRASQSSSSGWLRPFALHPEIVAGPHDSLPENCCQKRFTTTRDVRG